MKKIKFTKMVGSGNDFIVIKDKLSGNLSALAKSLCDRRFGIGADGLLVLESSKKADIRMRIFNADGSEAGMCGNGARCVAYVIARSNATVSLRGAERRSNLKKRDCFAPAGLAMTIETKAGIVNAQVYGKQVKVKITDPKGIKLDIPIKVNGRAIKVNFINTGVPHTVVFVNGINDLDVRQIGCSIRNHAKFRPAGTNVNFVEVKGPNTIRIRTYERGVEDETLACGTGSAASALIFALKNNLDDLVKVETQSGEVLKVYTFAAKNRDLQTADGFGRSSIPPRQEPRALAREGLHFQRVNCKFSNIWLEGSARIVYKGEYYV